MKDWIKHPLFLKGSLVDLIPLEAIHFTELCEMAKDKRIWEFLPVDCTGAGTFTKAYNEALKERERGKHYTFVIVNKINNKLIGSTRFFDIHPNDRKVEIGWTWIHPDFWGTGMNNECKLLLLTFCFETLKTIRVQFKASSDNIRSRKAIEKIGGKFEGIIGKDKIRENGTIRNAAYYIIIDEEWENVKMMLALQIK